LPTSGGAAANPFLKRHRREQVECCIAAQVARAAAAAIETGFLKHSPMTPSAAGSRRIAWIRMQR